MNWATSGGCWSRTSETKYSAIAWLRTSSARAPAPGRRCRAATAPPSAAPRPIPRCAGAAAPARRRRPRRRSSPAGRGFRPGRNTGRGREARTAPRPSAAGAAAAAGRCGWPAPAGRSRPASARPGRSCPRRPRPPRQWKSSTMIADPAGSSAASLAIDAMTSADMAPSIASRSAASAPNPGVDSPGGLDEPGPEADRVGIGLSQDSQDVVPGGRAAAQLDSSTLLPAPADPTTTVSRWPAPASAGHAAPAWRRACRAASSAGTSPPRTGRPARRRARPLRHLPQFSQVSHARPQSSSYNSIG